MFELLECVDANKLASALGISVCVGVLHCNTCTCVCDTHSNVVILIAIDMQICKPKSTPVGGFLKLASGGGCGIVNFQPGGQK